jgi:hypothetical protein
MRLDAFGGSRRGRRLKVTGFIRACGSFLVLEQRFHFASKDFISRAGFLEECGPLALLILQGRVI